VDVGSQDEFVSMGRVGAPHGIRGFVRIESFTEGKNGLLSYSPWFMRSKGQKVWQEVALEKMQSHGEKALVKFTECDDRDAAGLMTGAEIGVRRSQLPRLPDNGAYYWTDLQGLSVVDEEGECHGRVVSLFETGSNDVMVVKSKEKKEYLVPFVQGLVVKRVDFLEKKIIVDWVFEE
jgi:16S rRNA processing protein RimM